MSTIRKIAWRNIWRNKNRSLVIILAIALGLWAGMFVVAFYQGVINQRVRDVIEVEVSHIQGHHPKFRDHYQAGFTIPDSLVLSKLSKNPMVKVAGERLLASAMLASARNASGVMMVGVQPVLENRLIGLEDMVQQGDYFTGSDQAELLISRKLADKINTGLGDKVVVTFQDKHREITAVALRVTGVYRSMNGTRDERMVYMPYHKMKDLLNLETGTHEIAVLLKDLNQVDSVHQQLRIQFPMVQWDTWMQLSPGMEYVYEVTDQMMIIILGIILLALMFGLINTMLMAVLERTRELGVLMAVGMTRFSVFQMIVWETFMLTVLASFFGIMMGWLTVLITGRKGINLSAMSDVLQDFGYNAMVYPELDPIYNVKLTVMVVIMALLASFLPALKAILMKPVEAIRKM